MSTVFRASAPLAFYLAAAGVVILTAGLGLATLTGQVDHAAAVRYFGIFMGVLMVVSGNALPKLVQPQAARARASRIAGWLLLVGGLVVIALWLWNAGADNLLVTSATGLGIFGLVVIVSLVMTAGLPRVEAGGSEMHLAALHRSVLFQILHGVMWAFGFFLMAALGYGKDIPWVVALFTVSISMLDLCLKGRWVKRA